MKKSNESKIDLNARIDNGQTVFHFANRYRFQAEDNSTVAKQDLSFLNLEINMNWQTKSKVKGSTCRICTVPRTPLLQKPFFVYKIIQFQNAVLPSKSASMPYPSELHFTIDWSFKMRYCMNLYLNWHGNCAWSKFKVCSLLFKF